MNTTKKVIIAQCAAYMPHGDVAKTLARLSPKDDLFLALMQILSERVAMAVAEQSALSLSADSRAHIAGRMSELLGLQTELRNIVDAKR